MSAIRPEIPPPGRRLEFNAWCRVLTAALRRYIPDVAAFAKGHDRVVWRYGGQCVRATNDRGCYRIQLDPHFGGIQDFERHDSFTATTMTKTIAGHLDPRHSGAER